MYYTRFSEKRFSRDEDVFLVIEAKRVIFSSYEISHLVDPFIITKYMAKLNGWGMGGNLLCTDYLKHPVVA